MNGVHKNKVGDLLYKDKNCIKKETGTAQIKPCIIPAIQA
jgi:hypothetical protein